MVLGVVAVVLGVIAEVFGNVSGVFAFVLGAVVGVLPFYTLVPTKNQNLLIFMAFGLQMISVRKVISLFRRSGCILKNPH